MTGNKPRSRIVNRRNQRRKLLAQKKVVASLLFRVPAMSAAKVERLIELVQQGKYSESELVNLYDNAEERGVSAVMDAIERKMRADFPRAATRKFGPSEKKKANPSR